MILSESEKNRIKGLYGLMTEAETAPPPDESVLVDKKNPFKYPQYENARKEYKKELVDGDLFYVVDKEKLREILINEVKKYGIQFVNSLNNKTFRMNDTLYKFSLSNLTESIGKELIKEIGTSNYTSIFLSPINIGILDSENMMEYKTFAYVPKSGLYMSDSTFGNNFANELLFLNTENEGSVFLNPVYYDMVSRISNKNINQNWLNFIKSKIPNASIFPDDLFEIRKIQRQQTDF